MRGSTLESDVYRRQTKVDPRAVRVKVYPMSMSLICWDVTAEQTRIEFFSLSLYAPCSISWKIGICISHENEDFLMLYEALRYLI